MLPDRDDDSPYPTSSKVESEMSLSRTMKLAHGGSMRQTISVFVLTLSVYAVLYIFKELYSVRRVFVNPVRQSGAFPLLATRPRLGTHSEHYTRLTRPQNTYRARQNRVQLARCRLPLCRLCMIQTGAVDRSTNHPRVG